MTTPLIPRSIVSVISLALTVLLLWHVYADVNNDAYDGWKTTFGLMAMVLFTLGYDINKWRGNGGTPS